MGKLQMNTTMTPYTLPDLSSVAPELLLIGVGLLLLGVDLFSVKQRYLLPGITFAGILSSMILLHLSSGAIIFNGMYHVDGYSVFFKSVCLVGVLFTVLLSERYLQTVKLHHGEYYSLLIFATVGMMVMISAGDMIVLYLGLELMALSVYCLVGLLKHDTRANEASLKYFLMGAFSSAILLYGISLIYGLTGTTDLMLIAQRIASLELLENQIMAMALGLVLVALCFKVAAAPFHMWAPDVYEGAPTSITAFMSVAPKAASLAVLGRVFIMGFAEIHVYWGPAIAAIALLTMGIGNIVAISQKSLKRMLAYSSIAHAGYALLGILAGSTEGLSAAMYYMLTYAFMSMGTFGIVILLCNDKRRGEQLDDYRGLAKSNPLLAALMLVFLLSLTGLPPTGGFIGKLYLLIAAVHAGYIWTVVIAMIFSVISAYYYLRVIRYMYTCDPVSESTVTASPAQWMALTLAATGVVALGVIPGTAVSWASRSLFGG